MDPAHPSWVGTWCTVCGPMAIPNDKSHCDDFYPIIYVVFSKLARRRRIFSNFAPHVGLNPPLHPTVGSIPEKLEVRYILLYCKKLTSCCQSKIACVLTIVQYLIQCLLITRELSFIITFLPMWQVYDEIAEYMKLQTTIERLQTIDKRPVRTKLDVGCNYYMQVVV